MQHANEAVDEVRRAEFFRKGGKARGLVKGKRWLLLSRWLNLTSGKQKELIQLFALNRKLFKAYLIKESLDRLWNYTYEGAMLNYLQRWIDQLRWQRLKPFEKEISSYAAGTSRRDSELLPHQVPNGLRRSREREHQIAAAPWAGIQESAVPAAEGTAHGGDPDGKWDFGESRLKAKVA
jgi:Transposase